MKKSILTALFLILILGCASSKKKQETEQKMLKNVDLNILADAEKKVEATKEEKKSEKQTEAKTKTEVKYKPKKDASGKFEPFNMNKKTGNVNSSIDINGNGEVTITTEETDLIKESNNYTHELTVLNEAQKKLISIQEKEMKEAKSESVETKSSVFKLWIVLIVAVLMLAVSIYFHFARTKIPFINK
jgi:uncharacterized protein YcfL